MPNSELMTCKVVALTRLVRPDANLPATTALSLINRDGGRAHGLQRGANVVMPNLTPLEYRAKYEIYPEKAAVHETAEAINAGIVELLASLGRTVGAGPGGRQSQLADELAGHPHTLHEEKGRGRLSAPPAPHPKTRSAVAEVPAVEACRRVRRQVR